MSSPNPNIGGGITAAFGFLFLLLLPFQGIFKALDCSEFYVEHLGDLIKNLVIILVAVLLIYHFRYQKLAGLISLKPKNTSLVIVPFYFVFAGPMQYWVLDYQFDAILIRDVMLLLLAMLSVGFSEELVFRGFILPHLIVGADTNRPLIIPITISAFLFGVLHFVNLLSADAHIALVLAQVTYASMFGIAFGVLLLRTGSIFPIGFLHGIINFSGSLHDLPGASEPVNMDEFKVWEALFSVLIVIPFLLFTYKQLPNILRGDLLAAYKKS